MTRREADILKKMRAGARLWRYSTSDTGYLIVGGECENVQKALINRMIDANLIEVDQDESFLRAESGSDEVYKVITV